MRGRTNSLFTRGLLLLVGLSLLGVALIGLAAFFVSRDLLTRTHLRLSGTEAPLLPAAAYAEAIIRPALRAAALVAGAGAVAAALGIGGWALWTQRTLQRMAQLRRHLAGIEQGDLSRPISASGDDELSALAHSLNRATAALYKWSIDKETRATERSEELEQKVRTYQAVRRIAGVVSTLRDAREMSFAVVTLIAESLGIDDVGLFGLDEATRRPVLSAASSEGARSLLTQRQVLRSGEDLVARALATGEAQSARDNSSTTVTLDGQEPSPIEYELALPLAVAGRVTGVLDLRSERAHPWTEDDVAALSMLADQVALVVENVRLTEESRETIATFTRRYGERTAQDWARTAMSTPMAYRFSGIGVTTIGAETSYAPPQRAEIVERSDEMRELRAPILAGDRVLGSVALRQPVLAQPWSEEDIAFVAAVCGQVGQALERTRLMDEAQSREAWTRRQNALIDRIWMSSTDVGGVLDTTIRELGTELGAKGTIRLRALSDWRADPMAPDVTSLDEEPSDA